MNRPQHPVLARVFATAAVFCALAGAAWGADVTAIRIGAEPAGATRVVVESNAALQTRMFTLAEQGMRLVLDMQRVDFEIPGEPAPGGQRRAPGDGLVSQYRFAQNAADTSRVVFDLAGPAAVANAFTLAPGAESPNWRLVIDLAPTGFEQFAAAAGVPTAVAAAPAPAAEMGGPEYVVIADAGPLPDAQITSSEPAAAPLLEKPVIVIDAGHGGHDAGTIGASGTHEGTITLAAALQLRDILLETGRYEVVLTRSTDTYLTLDQRVAIARDNNANLYISLHADASPSRNTSGATVYTVDARGQSRTRQKVESNAWEIVSAPQPQEVGAILLDLSMTDTKNQSSAFAEMLRESVSQVSTMVRNPHREDNFYVLLAPDVPAVLLEMGFMSNPADEANLKSRTYRNGLMSAVARSIDDYFGARRQRYAGN